MVELKCFASANIAIPAAQITSSMSFLFLLTVILSEPHEIQRSENKLLEKWAQKVFERVTSLFWLHYLSPVSLFVGVFLNLSSV